MIFLARFNDSALFHDSQTVGITFDMAPIMGDEQNGKACLFCFIARSSKILWPETLSSAVVISSAINKSGDSRSAIAMEIR